MSENNEYVIDTHSEIVIGNKVYLVERHFTGNRDVKQAVFTVVENEVKRENPNS